MAAGEAGKFEGLLPILSRWLRGRRSEATEEGSRSSLSRAWTPLFFTFGAALAVFAVCAWLVASVLPASYAHLNGPALFGVIVLYFMAAATSGIAVGFLFGVPRVMASGAGEAKPKELAGEETTAAEKVEHALLNSNTNLERISDWLTTAIIALSLANLHEVSKWLAEFGATAEKSLNACTGTDCGGAINVTIQVVIVFAGVWGLLLGYLHTRVFITLMLRETERALRQPWKTQQLYDDSSLQLRLQEGVAISGGAVANLPEADRRKVEELAKRDVSKVTIPEHALMIGQALLLVGKLVAAVAAANRAEKLAPGSKLIRSHAEEVKRRARETTDLRSRDERIVAARDLLFSPGGYAEAIEISEKLKAQGGPLPANFYVNLACAYAQQFATIQNSVPANVAGLDQARANAHRAVRDALRIGPQWRNRLRELYDLEHNPQSDKDLSVLRPDKVLDELLLPPAQPGNPPSDD